MTCTILTKDSSGKTKFIRQIEVRDLLEAEMQIKYFEPMVDFTAELEVTRAGELILTWTEKA